MKQDVLILHGWGISGKKYHKLQKDLEKKGYRVFAPDMPGFGSEPLKKPVMSVSDYAAFIKTYISQQKLNKPIIIAHSFGGRVAAKLLSENPTLAAKVIFTGSPLIKRKLPLKKRLLSLSAKITKKGISLLPEGIQQKARKGIYFLLGEWDYYKAGPLRETFKKVVTEDLSSTLPKLTLPTYIIWGEHDTMVPLRDGKAIAARIPHAQLIVVPQASHNLPYDDNAPAFTNAVLSVL